VLLWIIGNEQNESHLLMSDLSLTFIVHYIILYYQQNTLQEGVDQLDRAFDEYGINFLDTAEMYPVPTKAETQGSTDEAVAQFLKGRRREDIILATKVCGRADRITWLPRREENTPAALTKDQILDSVDASLERLGTDYVDLLQLHWPGMYRSED
jgi:aryl-alcohol dehydrogenase-like predicted oxidoreductase